MTMKTPTTEGPLVSEPHLGRLVAMVCFLTALGSAWVWPGAVRSAEVHPVVIIEAHRSSIYSLAFSSDGKLLVTGSGFSGSIRSRGEIRVWNVEEMLNSDPETLPKPVFSSRRNRTEVRYLTFVANDSILIAGGSNHVAWRTDGWQEIANTRQRREVILISPDGRRVVQNRHDPQTDKTITTIRHIDVESFDFDGGELVAEFEPTERQVYTAISPDGQHYAASTYERTVVVRSTIDGDLVGTTLPLYPPDKAYPYNEVVFNHDGTEILIHDLPPRFLSLDTLSIRTELVQGGIISNAAFSPDGKYLTTVDHSVRTGYTFSLWDVGTGQKVAHAGDVDRHYAITFSPDGRLIAVAGRDGKLRIFKLDDVLRGAEDIKPGKQ